MSEVPVSELRNEVSRSENGNRSEITRTLDYARLPLSCVVVKLVRRGHSQWIGKLEGEQGTLSLLAA